ncbi:unnamed protein product [Polarella glacialis]|nr:unnamed protein product [Polarella glacialis]
MLVQIRATASTPRLWHQSEARFMSKGNGKDGPAAFRVIHLLDPFSKAFHAAIWGLGDHRRWDFSVGGVSHRRRELALAQQMLLCWRLEHAKVNHIQCFFDIKNAFPSLSRNSIDRMLSLQFDEPENALLHQHHTEAVMNVTDGEGGSTLLKIRSGSTQGDSIGGAIFGQVLGPYMSEGMRRIKGCDHQWPFEMDDFLTGDHVNTALSLYADDVSVVAIVQDAEDATNVAKELFWAVDSAVKPASLALKKDITVVPRFFGRGAQQQMQQAINNSNNNNGVGTWGTTATYLGCEVFAKKCESREITARIHAAQAAWFALSGLWFEHDVPLKSRVRIFKANVMSVLVAGLEAYVLSESQIHKLESWRMAKVRILIEGKGTVKLITPEGDIKIRAIPDRTIRSRSHLFSVRSELCCRRMLWLHDRICHPFDSTAFRALLCQSLPFESYYQLDSNGNIAAHASPWLRQIVDDIAALHARVPAMPLVEQMQFGIRTLPSNNSPLRGLKSKIRKVRTFEIPELQQEEQAQQATSSSFCTCESCDFVGVNKRALQTHRYSAHGIIREVSLRVVANQCPFCKKTFSTLYTARQHVRKKKNSRCPKGGGSALSGTYPLVVPRIISCLFCKFSFDSIVEYNKHLAQCILDCRKKRQDGSGTSTDEQEPS